MMKKCRTEQLELENTINRICQMEYYFDFVQNAASKGSIDKDVAAKDMLQILIDYYEGGQWLADYECDERGELPAELKRGVLSEDGLYNLLNNIGNEFDEEKL